MKTILATAYAINPYKGSEDGMGWNFVLQIARFNQVIAITRENNRPHIEKYISENPDPLYQNVHFCYFDLPYWMRCWKKGGRGAMLYFLMWQWGVVSFIQKQGLKFDIVHNLNFHNDWTPSFLWKLGKPFVWGPVGHHPLIPSAYLQAYDRLYWVKDRLTWMVKQFFWKHSASLHKTIRKANHILCMNSSVPATLGIRECYSVVPSVATQDFGWAGVEKTKERFSLISAGRFVPLKGFDLSIRSFAAFYYSLSEKEQEKCDLTLVGSGPEADRLLSLADELRVAHKVRFISWMERSELMKKFKSASAFLFPSHEGAGMVVAEALSFGLPVICLDNEGPGQFIHAGCGYAIPQGDNQTTVAALAKAIGDLHASPGKRQLMSLAARQQFEDVFHWDRRGEQLQEIYAQL